MEYRWYLYRHHRSFHKIRAKSEYEAKLLLMVRKAYSSFYYKLVGEFDTKAQAIIFIKKTKNDGYVNDNNTLLGKEYNG